MSTGLANANIRIDQSKDEELAPGHEPMDVQVENSDDEADAPEYGDDGSILKIEHPDGAITISLDGKPIEPGKSKQDDTRWFANLADKMDDDEFEALYEATVRVLLEQVLHRYTRADLDRVVEEIQKFGGSNG